MDTYTIVNPKDGYSYAGSLEEIRKQIIDEAFDNNRPLERFEDQVEAVYPADPSELDEEQDRLIPRELTRELVAEMAASIWDVPIKHIKLLEGEDSGKGLATGLADLLGLSSVNAQDIAANSQGNVSSTTQYQDLTNGNDYELE